MKGTMSRLSYQNAPRLGATFTEDVIWRLWPEWGPFHNGSSGAFVPHTSSEWHVGGSVWNIERRCGR